MSCRQYPKIGRCDPQRRWIALPENEGPRCILCGSKATHSVHIEFSYFRGEDEVVMACAGHSKDAHALAAAWAKQDAAAIRGK